MQGADRCPAPDHRLTAFDNHLETLGRKYCRLYREDQGAAGKPRRTAPDSAGRLRGCVIDGVRGNPDPRCISGSDCRTEKPLRPKLKRGQIKPNSPNKAPTPINP